MAKKTLFAVAVVLIMASFAAAQDAAGAPVTFTAAAITPAAVPSTAAVKAVFADTGSATATVSFIDEEMMKLNVKELHLDITPSFKIVLPDTSVDLGLKQKIGDTTLEGGTSYNYIYNSIKYDLNYSLDLYFPVGLSLYDSVNFEQIYQNAKYIQRVKGLGLNLGTPEILSFLKLGMEFKNETTYLAELDSPLNIDQGLASLVKTWFQFDFKSKMAGKDYDMLKIYGDLEKAVPTSYSNYNFLFMNYSLNYVYRLEEESSITFSGNTGYMLVADMVPLWKIYSMGGFDSLLGYAINQFQDFYKVTTRVRYDQMLVDNINWETWWIRYDRIKFVAIADCGRVGDVHQLQVFSGYKFGAGIGLSLDLTFRQRTPIRATLVLGQALWQGYKPVVYFIYELL